MDDFGSGYASSGYLKGLPFDRLKLGRAFVAGLTGADATPADTGIVGATVTLARTLGLGVVAEGVETARQRHLLERLGCEQAQGPYFGEPLPADAFITAITHPAQTERPPTTRVKLLK